MLTHVLNVSITEGDILTCVNFIPLWVENGCYVMYVSHYVSNFLYANFPIHWYAGTVEHHNACKRHVATTLVSDKLNVLFHMLFQWNKNCKCMFIFEETMPQLVINQFLEIISHKTLTTVGMSGTNFHVLSGLSTLTHWA